MPVLSTDLAFASRWSTWCARRNPPGELGQEWRTAMRNRSSPASAVTTPRQQRSDHARPLPLPHLASTVTNAVECAQAGAEREV
jgi:hypothetical protein